jgi:hypothetical protein
MVGKPLPYRIMEGLPVTRPESAFFCCQLLRGKLLKRPQGEISLWPGHALAVICYVLGATGRQEGKRPPTNAHSETASVRFCILQSP